jgi:hypothetical protein
MARIDGDLQAVLKQDLPAFNQSLESASLVSLTSTH